MNETMLWKKRVSERLMELLRYGRYMFNDHLLLVLIFAIGGGAYYYKDWVATLDETFPTAIVFAILFSIFLTSGNVMTFLKEADKVFLLPIETKLRSYFIRSFVLSLVWQLFILFVVSLVVAPIFFKTILTGIRFPSFLILLVVLKTVNLWIRWLVDYDMDRQTLIFDTSIRYIINGLVVFLILENQLLLWLITFLIFLLYSLYNYWKVKENGLPWEQLIHNEDKRMALFYQIANLFTDVPQLRNRVKRRKWLDLLLATPTFAKERTYGYLFTRTFLRSGDYFGLFIRLSVIGGFLVWGLEGSYVAYAVAILFIYLTGIQLMSLWKQYDAVIWTDLYPVADQFKHQAFQKLLLTILWTQNLIFTCLFLTSMEWVKGILLFAVLGLFSYAFVYLYSTRRIRKWDEEW